MKSLARISAASALVLALASCSSGGGSSDGGSDTTIPGSGDSMPVSPGDFDSNDCLASAEAFGGIAVEVAKAMTDPANFDTDEFKKLIETSRVAVDDEIKDEFDLISGVYLDIAEVYSSLEDPTDIAALAQNEQWSAVLDKMSETDFTAAYDALSTYYASACGLAG